MRLGLYGGTFDPIHHGHLILAGDAVAQLALDRVIFIPAAVSPHKLHTVPTPPEVRRAMVAAAIAGDPRFSLDDSELHRAGPSFTIDTVEQIRARRPGSELFYFIGADNVRQLDTWRRIEDLRRLAQFVVFEREAEAPAHDFPRLARRIDITATEIRQRVARGESIRYLVSEPVRALITQHQLYQEPSHRI